MSFELLEFDSNLFGFKVAKITTPSLATNQLATLLQTLRSLEIHLVYWQFSQNDKESQYAAQQFHGFLASNQITYVIHLNQILPPPIFPEVMYYDKIIPSPELYDLAEEIGKLSRFGMDNNLPNKLMRRMYYAWIENSANRSLAQEILVIKETNKIIAMTTLGEKNHRGDLGLVAVNKNHVRRQLGSKLIYTALRYFISHDYETAQVITQQTNLPACSLYEKCGFTIEKIDNFYHFWL